MCITAPASYKGRRHIMRRSRSSARQSPRPQRCVDIDAILPQTRAITVHPRQNFLALCASGYYDNCLWHRNIKGFMIQTGDPSGSGKDGQSIWGKPFPDEVRTTLKVPRHHALPPAMLRTRVAR